MAAAMLRLAFDALSFCTRTTATLGLAFYALSLRTLQGSACIGAQARGYGIGHGSNGNSHT